MDSVTQAVATAYAAVLSRKTKRTWLICPGPAANSSTTGQKVNGTITLEQHEDTVRHDAAGALFERPTH